MPTEDYSNTLRTSRIRQHAISVGSSKQGNPVSASLFLSRTLGTIPIKIKNSSGVTTTGIAKPKEPTQSTNPTEDVAPTNPTQPTEVVGPTGPPELVSFVFSGSDYGTSELCPDSQTRIRTFTATFNKQIISCYNEFLFSTFEIGFEVSGNTATIVIPKGIEGQCTEPGDVTVPLTLVVDEIYNIPATLVIPANT